MKNISKLSLALVVSLGVAGVAKGFDLVLDAGVMVKSIKKNIPELKNKVSEIRDKISVINGEMSEAGKKLMKLKPGQDQFKAVQGFYKAFAEFNDEFKDFFKDLNDGILDPTFSLLGKVPGIKENLIVTTKVKTEEGETVKEEPISDVIGEMFTDAERINGNFKKINGKMSDWLQPKGGAAAAPSKAAAAAPAEELEL